MADNPFPLGIGVKEDSAEKLATTANIPDRYKLMATDVNTMVEALQYLNSLAPITVASYAEATPLFAGTDWKRIYVESDEAYNGGEPSFYDYVPGIGVAFLGLDFNYTE